MLQSSKKISPSLHELFICQHWMDFNFTHFAHFKFAYFETEVSFGLIWVNLQNGWFHLLVSSIPFIFAHFVCKRNFGQIWIKIIDWSIRVENCYFPACFTYLVKFIIYNLSLSSSRSNKKQFQIVDLVIRPSWYSYFGL